MENYDLTSSTWGKEETEALYKVIESGNYTMGNNVETFEKEFADKFGSKYAVMVNSGSSANLIAIGSLFYRSNPLKRGDEIIVPAVSWSTSYSPLQLYGLKLVFVDIDLETLNYDLEKLENAITSNTKAILAVNLLGNSNDFNGIKKMIGKKNILLIEDNCESMGSMYNNKFTGTIGLLGTFSLFYSHHLSTMEGGVVTTNDEELYHIMLSLRSHGWTRNLPQKNKLTIKSKDSFIESFRFILPGYNLRPLEMSAAAGIEQLKKHDDFLRVRRKNAKHFKSLFKDNKSILTQKEISDSSWFGFSIILKKGNRKKILDKLNEAKISYRPIVSGNFVKNEALRYYDFEVRGNLNASKYLDKNGFFVGNHHIDISEKIDLLHEVLMKYK